MPLPPVVPPVVAPALEPLGPLAEETGVLTPPTSPEQAAKAAVTSRAEGNDASERRSFRVLSRMWFLQRRRQSTYRMTDLSPRAVRAMAWGAPRETLRAASTDR